MIDLKGKVAVVFGLANKRSIAWGIAQKLSEAGATLAICYQNERLQTRSRGARRRTPRTPKTFRCDVSIDAEIDSVFEQLKEHLRQARHHRPLHRLRPPTPSRTLSSRPPAKTSASPSTSAPTRSSPSARAAEPLMTEGGSILTLTYYGSTKVFPNYNIMGRRQGRT